jgi:hypothetical protein
MGSGEAYLRVRVQHLHEGQQDHQPLLKSLPTSSGSAGCVISPRATFFRHASAHIEHIMQVEIR